MVDNMSYSFSVTQMRNNTVIIRVHSSSCQVNSNNTAVKNITYISKYHDIRYYL